MHKVIINKMSCDPVSIRSIQGEGCFIQGEVGSCWQLALGMIPNVSILGYLNNHVGIQKASRLGSRWVCRFHVVYLGFVCIG